VDDSKIEHQVRCFFIKSKSWKKEGVSETLLQHEQLHFDIAELFARKLRKDLSRKTSINDNNEIYFKGIYKNVINECIAMQLQYDRETNHSRNRQFQVLWEGAIQEKLQQLSNYNKELVVSDTNLE
jgi:predicted secreted Zn-dependent protease